MTAGRIIEINAMPQSVLSAMVIGYEIELETRVTFREALEAADARGEMTDTMREKWLNPEIVSEMKALEATNV